VSDAKFVLPESEGVVEVWDGDNVPGAASKRERLESVQVVGDVGDDHFRDFIREGTCRFIPGTRPWKRTTEDAIGLGFASAPNCDHVSRNVCPCSADGTVIRTIT